MIRIREVKENGWSSGNIESKGGNVLNEKRNITRGHEKQFKDFWIGLDWILEVREKIFKQVKRGT